MARIPLPVEEEPLAILSREASSSRAPRRLTRISPLPQERPNRSSPIPRRKPSLVEKVVFMSKEVTRSIKTWRRRFWRQELCTGLFKRYLNGKRRKTSFLLLGRPEGRW